MSSISRRRLLVGAAAGFLAGAAGAVGEVQAGAAQGGTATTRRPSRVGSTRILEAGSRPDPTAAPGTDLVPQIENFVVVMMENHSFDNLIGMLGRGDCFPKGPDGRPLVSLPDGQGNLVQAFHMPSECQASGVGNDWSVAHHAFDEGSNRGVVEASTGEALGYYTDHDIPFTWGLARTFPLADRWFASVPGQTNPNRRYLLAGTSLGQIADTNPLDLPPNGTIFHALNRYGISWKEYYSDVPTMGVWLALLGDPAIAGNLAKIDRFYEDAAAGQLPQFSYVEPDYGHSSEENPQDIQFGDQFLANVVKGVMSGPQWSKTMLIWTYDEWGGWYDHVLPPPALPPDDVAPVLSANLAPGGFDRYGYRVPGGVVSPFARRDHVSHTLYDHTSVLKTLERKWNLPAFTRRDANAHDLFDMVDLKGSPAFAVPPDLPKGADPIRSAVCLTTGPGIIPPPLAVRHGVVAKTPVIGPSGLSAGQKGQPYRAQLSATGRGPAHWSIIGDDLPDGLVLDPSSGAVNGTPKSSGTSTFKIGVRRGGGPVGSRSYTLTIA